MQKKVLIVDDEPNTVKFLSLALRKNGYLPLAAYDGKEGLEKVAEFKPDLVILDVMMPKKTGWVVFRQLRKIEQYRSIPVIMLTAVSDVLKARDTELDEEPDYGLKSLLRKAIQQMREDGLNRPELFVDKPIDPQELVEDVRNLIG